MTSAGFDVVRCITREMEKLPGCWSWCEEGLACAIDGDGVGVRTAIRAARTAELELDEADACLRAIHTRMRNLHHDSWEELATHLLEEIDKYFAFRIQSDSRCVVDRG